MSPILSKKRKTHGLVMSLVRGTEARTEARRVWAQASAAADAPKTRRNAPAPPAKSAEAEEDSDDAPILRKKVKAAKPAKPAPMPESA